MKFAEDEAGNITEFIYDYEINSAVQNGNLVKVRYPDATLPDGTIQNNCITSLTYDTRGQLIEQLSPENRKKTYDYYLTGNGAGLVKKIEFHDSVASFKQSLEYDALGNTKRVVDGAGHDTLFEYNSIRQLVKIMLPMVDGSRAVYKFAYNEDRKIAKEYLPRGSYSDTVITDPFIVNEYFYDVVSRLVEVIKFSNTEFPQRTKFERDLFGNVKRLLDPIGQEYRYRYDDRNLMLEEMFFANTEFPFVTKYHFDLLGNLDKITYPDSNEDTFNYDEQFSRLRSQTNYLGVVQEFTYGLRDELRTQTVKDAAGIIIQARVYNFDEKGRMIRAEVNGLTSSASYDKDNLVIKTTNHQGNNTMFQYDGIGRLIKTIDPLGNSTESGFDPIGNTVSTKINSLSSSGAITQIVQQTIYDSRNRPVQIKDPLGNVITFLYDDRNQRTGVINALGQQVNTYFDLNNQPIKTTSIRNGVENIINRWNRDLIGRIASFQDAENNITQYVFDNRNNLVRTDYSDGSAVTKEYDNLSRLIRETDCNGTVSNFNYNNFSQLVQVDFQVSGGAVQTPVLKYGYDSFGIKNVITRGTYAITRKFDAFNRIVEEMQGSSLVKKVFDDVNGNIVLHYPDGRTDKYITDKIGRIREIVFDKAGTNQCLVNDFPAGTVLARYDYNGHFFAQKEYANKTKTIYEYNGDGLLSSMIVKDKQGNVIDGESYLYDGEKRKHAIFRHALQGCNSLFQYDDMSRLTNCYKGIQAQIPGNLATQAAIDAFISGINLNVATQKENYSLTDNDKRSGWQVNNTQYNAAYNNLLQVTSLTGTDGTNIGYSYDKNGNRISDNLYNYFYDACDNLVKVVRKSDQTVVIEHDYDGGGRIILRKEGNHSCQFIYDALRSIHETFDDGSVRQNTFGIALDEYVVQSKGLANHFVHQNSLLSLNCVTDVNSRPLQYFDFNAFGFPDVFNSAKSSIAITNSLTNILFAGRPYITSIGKYDFRKRIYDQQTGLFMQRDLYAYAQSANQYLYGKHNPINNFDPLGDFIPLVVGVLAVAAGGAAISAGFNIIRQGIQIAEYDKDEYGIEKQEIDWVEVQHSAHMGSIIAPALVIAPVLAVPLAGLGIYNGISELEKGHIGTGIFDIASSVIPLKSVKNFMNSQSTPSGRFAMTGLQTMEAWTNLKMRVSLNKWKNFVSDGNVKDAKRVAAGFDKFRNTIIELRVAQQLLNESWLNSNMSVNIPMKGNREIGEVDVMTPYSVHEVKTGSNFFASLNTQLPKLTKYYPDKSPVVWIDRPAPEYHIVEYTGENKGFKRSYLETLKNIEKLKEDAIVRYLDSTFLQGEKPKLLPEGIPIAPAPNSMSPKDKN